MRRRCKWCRKAKPRSAYWQDKGCHGGYDTVCIACKKSRRRLNDRKKR